MFDAIGELCTVKRHICTSVYFFVSVGCWEGLGSTSHKARDRLYMYMYLSSHPLPQDAVWVISNVMASNTHHIQVSTRRGPCYYRSN